jgi:hypothetical protein
MSSQDIGDISTASPRTREGFTSRMALSKSCRFTRDTAISPSLLCFLCITNLRVDFSCTRLLFTSPFKPHQALPPIENDLHSNTCYGRIAYACDNSGQFLFIDQECKHFWVSMTHKYKYFGKFEVVVRLQACITISSRTLYDL